MMQKLPLLNTTTGDLMAIPAIGNIDAYIYWINQLPILSAAEELELAIKLRDQQDLQAARRLVFSHLRFVVHIAKNYLGYGLPKADLIQEGTIGLMKAVKKFDPAVGVRLVSFAVHWIKAEIHEYILRNWRIVKIATTKAQRKLFFNLRRASKKLNWLNKQEIEAVADKLKVKTSEVRTMEARIFHPDFAFDGHEEDEDEHATTHNPATYLASDTVGPAEALVNENFNRYQLDGLATALEQLDLRSRQIIEQRWLAEPRATLHDLAAQYKISAERIRQIEEAAIKKLKQQLQTTAN